MIIINQREDPFLVEAVKLNRNIDEYFNFVF